MTPRPVVTGPWSLPKAWASLDASSAAQQDAIENLQKQTDLLSEAERVYRIALSQEIFHLHEVKGIGWSTCEVIAKGSEQVAELRKKRDEQKAVVKAAEQANYKAAGDRRGTELIADWSKRRELAENGQDTAGSQPAWTPTVVNA